MNKRKRVREERVETIKGWLVVLFLVVVFIFCGIIEQHYTLEATAGYQEEGISYFYDDRGMEWCYTNCSVVQGQRVKLVMNTNGTTDYIYDDEIVKIKPMDIVETP